MLALLAPVGRTAVLVFPEGRPRSECLETQSTGHRLTLLERGPAGIALCGGNCQGAWTDRPIGLYFEFFVR